MSDQLAKLARAIGVPATAARLLEARTFDASAEQFFLTHYPELSWRELLPWLTHPEPAGDEPRRAVAAVAERIAESLGSPVDAIALIEVPNFLPSVRSAHVRNEVLDALRGRVGSEHWFRFALAASGGAIFNTIRDFEQRLHDREFAWPSGILEPGPVPILTTDLFDAKRSDDECIAAIQRFLREGSTRFYVVWLLRELDLLTRVGEPDVVVGDVPAVAEQEPASRARDAFLLQVAREWPDPDQRKEWFTRRALAGAGRGVSWYSLWWDIPPDLRDHVALQSRGMPSPAPWLPSTLVQRARTKADWEPVFELLSAEHAVAHDTGFDADEFNRGLAVARLALDRQPSGDEVTEAFQACEPQSWAAAIANASLPVDADDEFDTRFADLVHLPDEVLVRRLLTLPQTPERAGRVVALALRSGVLWHLDAAHDLVRRAASMPEPPIPLPPFFTEESIGLFRVLAGDDADAVLGNHLSDLLRAERIHDALGVAQVAVDVVSDEHRTTMSQLVRRLPLSEVARISESFPWLVSEQEVTTEALRDARDDWGHVERLPEYLRPVMEAKAVRAGSADLAAALLDRLEALGVPRRHVLALVLERLRTVGGGAIAASWLATKLDTKSLWAEPGTEIVLHLLRHGEPPDATLVANLCLSAALRARDADLCRTMHATVGTCLVTIAETSLADGNVALAQNALAGLAHLNVPPRLRTRVRALRKLAPPEEILALVEVNEALLRRSGGQDAASVDAICDALTVLVRGAQAESAS